MNELTYSSQELYEREKNLAKIIIIGNETGLHVLQENREQQIL